MSEYYFGAGHGKVAKKTERALNSIAQRHDRFGFFVAVTLPGEGPRYWFGCENRGSPFQAATAKTILDEAKEAGFWPIGQSN